MVKSGRDQLVQVIEVNTISDGLIWHPLPPSVMHWKQHSIILGVSLLGIQSPNPYSPWILVILEQIFFIRVLQNRKLKYRSWTIYPK